MSRFWAAASSSEDEQDSNKSDSDEEQQINQRQTGGKFGYAEESESGKKYDLLLISIIYKKFRIRR